MFGNFRVIPLSVLTFVGEVYRVRTVWPVHMVGLGTDFIAHVNRVRWRTPGALG